MYQLTCPACSTCVDRPFVRVGARAVCGKCEHTYQVAGDQLKHEVVIPEFSPSANPLLLGGAATKPPPPMKPAPKPAAPPTPEPEPEPRVHSEPPSPTVARMIAKRRAARRRKQQLVTLLIVTGVLLVIIAAGIFIGLKTTGNEAKNALTGTSGAEQTQAGNDSQETGTPDALTEPDISVLRAERLSPTLWEEIYSPFEPSMDPNEMQLGDDRIVSSGTVESVYIADVNASKKDTVELANVNLMLVDSSDMIFARAQVPIMLVGGPFLEEPSRKTLRVRIPKRLADRTIRVERRIEIVLSMNEPEKFTDMIVETEVDLDKPTLKITAYNPLTVSMQRAVFCINALDSEGEVVARYRLNWSDPVGPRERLVFKAALPTARQWGIRRWQVLAAAEPQQTFESSIDGVPSP